MAYDDVLTRNENEELAVRTVSATEQSTVVNPNDVYTRDTEGNLAVRTVGGSGGSIDETKVIVLSDTIPEANADSLGKFYCYKGITNQNYTHGYVYECVKSGETYTGTVNFEPATLSGTVVSCSGDVFAAFVATGSATPAEVVSGTMTYNYASSIWVFSGLDSNDNEVAHRQIYQSDYEDYGFTFTGTPQDGDVVAFTCSVEESGGIYTWTRVNLQPGSEHDLGFFDTVAELQAAHPTGTAGDFALIGATDTFWVWDTTTSTWVDSHKADAVTSVNGQTGDVTVQATLVNQSNIKSVNGNSLLGSGNLELSTYLPYPAGWTTTGTTKAFCDDIAADTTAIGGKAYLGEVTFNDLPASMSNAEIVVEIMAGTTAQNKVIVLTCTSGNTAPYMWKYTYWDNGTNVSGWKGFQEQLVSGTNIKTINSNSILGSGNLDIDGLPSQTGNAGKVLTTNGTVASWETPTTITMRTWGANE